MGDYNSKIELLKRYDEIIGNKDVCYKCKSNTIRWIGFRDIMAKKLFSMDSIKCIKMPAGIDSEGKVVSITLGEDISQHGLIVGRAGSGKSTLLHTIIMSSMLNYSPDQIKLYLMDFTGTEFNVYKSDMFPHIQMTALVPEREIVENILEKLVTEMTKRFSLFHEARQTSFDTYRRTTGKPLPRILVIMDEVYGLLNACSHEDYVRRYGALIEKLVSIGHHCGIHLLMTTQSAKWIANLGLPAGIIQRINIRIGLGCDEKEAEYLFVGQSKYDAMKTMEMMQGPIGTAVMNTGYGKQPDICFRAAYCDSETQRSLLDLLSSLKKIIQA